MHDLQSKLDKAGVYFPAEVDAYYAAYTKAMANSKGEQRQSLLKAVLDPIVDRYRSWLEDARKTEDAATVKKAEEFRDDLSTFVRAFGFLSQIYNYESTDLEKRSYFYAGLARLIRDRNDDAPLDLSSVKMTHLKIESKGKKSLQLDNTISPMLDPMGVGGSTVAEVPHGPLSEVVRLMNELLGEGIGESDAILQLLQKVDSTMMADPIVAEQAKNNSAEQFINAGSFIQRGKEELVNAREQIVNEHAQKSATVDDAVNRLFSDKESLDAILRAMAARVHKYHNTSSPGSGAI